MTTHATTIPESRGGVRALLGMSAFTLVTLVGAALWLVRSDAHEAVAPSARPPATAALEGAGPPGGLVERDRGAQPIGAARVTTNGMVELDGGPAKTIAPMAEGTHDVDPGMGDGAARAAALGTGSQCGLELQQARC